VRAPRNRRHILVPHPPLAERYKPHQPTIFVAKPEPPTSRVEHGRNLAQAFKDAVLEAHRRREDAGIEVHGAIPGLYVQFESQPGVSLQVDKLEDARQGITVVAVTQTETSEPKPQKVEAATVFVPEGKVKRFLGRFEAYAKAEPKLEGERRYEVMIDPVATLRLATLRALWTDSTEAYPSENEAIWWEVWLRRQDGAETERLMEFAGAKGCLVSPRRLMFDDRIVTLVRATPSQLAASIDVLSDVAEMRKAKETATVFIEMSPVDQGEWAKELRDRTTPPSPDAPAVCILDTGVTRGHPLLEASLDARDCHTCEPAWGTHDHSGHGTPMAGLALFGDLAPVLADTQDVVLQHRLESVKILPPAEDSANSPDLYGAITAEATSRVEVEAPARRRVFSMSISATDERDRGQPSSWSAAIDALAAGRSFDPNSQGLQYIHPSDETARRLFVLCAGNVDRDKLCVDHLDRSDAEPIHDPGQAWNALTVGAMTEKAVLHHPKWASWHPVAPPGELSPYSTTGTVFANDWPLKPDVVFEGGNIVKNAQGSLDFPCDDLSLLSTYFQPSLKAFVLSCATSAATAQVARLAAIISAEYPTYWPETVRALVVHAAEWTARMTAHVAGSKRKVARANLVQRYGFGVPSVERALRSANDALTLVVQSSLRPFTKGKLRELQFFALPWPREVLTSLGETTARLRLTLSYFIKPNPGRRGWKKRHRYASHGLRFAVKRPYESDDDFRKRLNELALEEDEAKPESDSKADKWFLGERTRNRGSIHSDWLETTAADLAERGTVAIYPVSGWWKDLPKRDRSEAGARYALIISIETPEVEADIWTPVAQQVGVPIELMA
jgi:hypothetical protein